MHKSLKSEGKLLITLPLAKTGSTQLLVNNKTVFEAYFHQPNFNEILAADNKVINQCITDRMFQRVASNKTPIEEGTYYVNTYDSIDKWVTNELTFCADADALRAFADRMRDALNTNDSNAIEIRDQYRKYHQVLIKC